MYLFLNRAALVGLALVLAVTSTSAAALGSYNVDPGSVSVSGLSSGGFMSVQLGVAYSGTFQTGFGAFAGGPYDCARNQLVREPVLDAIS
jgi:poly(3-hydroxybutyrate) depolymerase